MNRFRIEKHDTIPVPYRLCKSAKAGPMTPTHRSKFTIVAKVRDLLIDAVVDKGVSFVLSLGGTMLLQASDSGVLPFL